MAGKYGSPSIWFLLDGFSLLSAKIQELRAKIEALTVQTSGVGDSWREHTPVGVAVAELEQKGALFDTNSPIHALHDTEVSALTPQSTARVICIGFAGQTIGNPFFGFQATWDAAYEVLAEDENLTKANVKHTVSGALDRGVILHALTQETTDPATTEPGSSVDHTTESTARLVPITSSAAAGDIITCSAEHGLAPGDTVVIAGHSGSTPNINGTQTVLATPSATTFSITTDITVGGTGGTCVQAKSNAGGTAYMQYTQLTLGGFTSATTIVRHSVDNSTFADLLQMTTVTGSQGAERKTVAGAVNRYLAATLDFIGAGAAQSMTYFLGFCRN